MKIDSLKDLEKLIKLCRKTGIEAIEVEGLKMNLGPTPVIISEKRQKSVQKSNDMLPVYTPGGITEDTKIETNGLTDEQLLFYSAQGHIDNEQQ